MSLCRAFRRTLALEERTREETHDGTSAFLLRWFRALEESTEQAFRGYLPTMIHLRQFDPNQKLPGPLHHRFFRPWPLDVLEKHEKNNQIPEATKRLLRMQSIMEADDMGLEGRNPESITWERTRFLCARLGAEVQVFPRNGTEGNRQALSHLTRWRHERFVSFETISFGLETL